MSSRLPLDGLRVIDVATWIAAPKAAVVIGDYGAEVVKVQRSVDGDPHRADGTALVGVPKSPINDMWHLDAHDKRSMALDLKHSDGRAALDRLIASPDVLTTSFPHPGADDTAAVLAETGRSPDEIAALKASGAAG